MEVISKAIEGTADLGKSYHSMLVLLHSSQSNQKLMNFCFKGMILGPCLGYVMQTMTMV